MEYKRITISWVDAHVRSGWEEISEYDNPKVTKCEATGYLIRDTEECLVLALTISGNDMNGILCVPRQCVLSQTSLT